MRTTHKERLSEALQAFVDTERAKDFQDFVIALVFFRRYDLSLVGENAALRAAVEQLKEYVKPLRAITVTPQQHAEIRARALAIVAILSGELG